MNQEDLSCAICLGTVGVLERMSVDRADTFCRVVSGTTDEIVPTRVPYPDHGLISVIQKH